MYSEAAAWEAGPGTVYRLLATAALGFVPGEVPGDLTGVVALDAGAGTGAAGRILAARGATVVSLDLSEPMVRRAPGARVVGDVSRLPFRANTFGLVTAFTVLSHVDDPARAAGELTRVARPGAVIAITAFPVGQAAHSTKAAADRVLAAAGYAEPQWHRRLKSVGEVALGSAEALSELARGAGWSRAQVHRVDVALRELSKPELAAWRLGMPQVAAWLSVHSGQKAAVADALEAALPDAVEPLRLLVLIARR